MPRKVKKKISELRQDIVSKDWVVIATGRAKRPNEFVSIKQKSFAYPKSNCPFEDLHPEALMALAKNGASLKKQNWWVQVIPNKYPALAVRDKNSQKSCAVIHNLGPYNWTEGEGAHEVVITRDHTRSIAKMTLTETELLIRAFQDRYLALQNDPCIEYISIFHNHGRKAGATMPHPHSQIIATPVVPPDVYSSLTGSAVFFYKEKKCVHCVALDYELKNKVRIVFENEDFAVVAPFASRTAFEMRIFPKIHNPYFSLLEAKQRVMFADALHTSLAKLYKGLNNPDYNFFIHTAPVIKHKENEHYHWHLEILPKTAIWAGFEIGTGIDISTIAPETAAKFLKKIKKV